jgi:hypothetical protein
VIEYGPPSALLRAGCVFASLARAAGQHKGMIEGANNASPNAPKLASRTSQAGWVDGAGRRCRQPSTRALCAAPWLACSEASPATPPRPRAPWLSIAVTISLWNPSRRSSKPLRIPPPASPTPPPAEAPASSEAAP